MSDQFSDLNNVLCELSDLRKKLSPEEQVILDQLITRGTSDEVEAHASSPKGAVYDIDEAAKPAANPRAQPRSTPQAADPVHYPDSEVEAHQSSVNQADKGAFPQAEKRSSVDQSFQSFDDEVEAHRFWDKSATPQSEKGATPSTTPRSSSYGQSVTISFDPDSASYQASKG